jgi:hypothetical protein
MPSTNFTIDNINPMIQYGPQSAWSEGDDAEDSLGSQYFKGTFTTTTTFQSFATFTFNGTQVFICGAKRSNHGPYQIHLDGLASSFDGFSAEAILQQPLYTSPVLEQGQHTVTLINYSDDPNRPFLDLDFITWTTTLEDGESGVIRIQDTDSAFVYAPADAWSTNLGTLTGFDGGSGHVSSDPSASVSFKFQGDSISVFGVVGPFVAPYTVQIDGVPAPTMAGTSGASSGSFNATKQSYIQQVALYRGSGLGAGSHTITLMAHQSAAGQMLAIDYAELPSVAAGTQNGGDETPAALVTTTSTGATQPGTTSKCVLSTSTYFTFSHQNGFQISDMAILIGVLVSVVVLLSGACLIFWWSRLNRDSGKSGLALSDEEKRVDVEIAAPPMLEPQLARRPQIQNQSRPDTPLPQDNLSPDVFVVPPPHSVPSGPNALSSPPRRSEKERLRLVTDGRVYPLSPQSESLGLGGLGAAPEMNTVSTEYEPPPEYSSNLGSTM